MQLEREWLSGTPISQTDRTKAVDSTDVFLISEPFVDRQDCSQFFSKKLDYETLSSHILKDIRDTLRLGSMAWELSDGYARWDHTHSYSTVEVEPLIEKTDDTMTLADIVIDGKYNTINMEKPQIPSSDKPDIGQLKFLSRLSQKSIDSEDFDGWVYPDGRYLDKTRFSEAFNVFGIAYGESDDHTQFAIPRFDHFIKANPCLQITNLNNYVHFVNGVGIHSHDVTKMNTTREIDAVISVWVTGKALQGGCAHGGKYHYENGKLVGKIMGNVTTSLNFEIDSLSVGGIDTGYGAANVESYPKYNIVPVLMYVGGEA